METGPPTLKPNWLNLSGAAWLSSMRSREVLRIGEPATPSMRQVPTPGFANVRDRSSSDEDSADPLVLGGVSDDHGQARGVRTAGAASARSYSLRDRLDDASQTAPGDGECDTGAVAR